jgi:hypothetical protein
MANVTFGNDLETKKVTRQGRRVTSWRIVEVGAFSCGHAGKVETKWRTEGDGQGPACVEVVREFEKVCPDCRVRELGGGAWLDSIRAGA